MGRVYEDLAGCTALEAEERLAEEKELLPAMSVWREWTDGYGEWNREEREAFLERNREILENYPNLNPEGSYLSYLTNYYSEQDPIDAVLSQASAAAHYEDYLAGIDGKAEIMTASSLFGDPDTFSYQNIERTPPVYAHLKGTVLPAADSEGVLLATGFPLTDVFLLAAFLLLAFSMLVGEREEGTLLLIKPAKRGYLETIAAKLLTMLFFSVALTLFFYGTNLFLSDRLLGLGALSRLVQSIRGMLASPYAMTAGQYLRVFRAFWERALQGLCHGAGRLPAFSVRPSAVEQLPGLFGLPVPGGIVLPALHRLGGGGSLEGGGRPLPGGAGTV